MKDFYYFSKRRLKFVEVKNFNKKFLLLTTFSTIVLSFLLLGIYITINGFVNPNSDVEALQKENRELTIRLNEMNKKFEILDSELDEISKINSSLRLKTNLAPLDYKAENIGIGGSVFNDISSANTKEIGSIISSMSSAIDKIESKIKFEKSNYSEIENALVLNDKLFNAIPAIKPANGLYGDRFGLRMHPILKRKRMHNGIDILSDIGTKVYAPGDGKVVFSGRKGGYGLTIEVEHGFGYRTLYAHLSKSKVKKGQKVKRGDLIALSGKSGNLATGAHLHYEIRHNGVALNPRNFIYDDVKLFEVVSSD